MAQRLQRGEVGTDQARTTTTTTTTTTTAAATPAAHKDEKHEENIVVKAAHTIRDKVQELTAGVKEKAHNLRHSDDSKK